MRKAFLVLFLAFALSELTRAGESDQTFLSWYDGWGTHTIWGIGKIASGYSSATVRCGTKLIRVRPIYDTHSDVAKPTATQTREFAETANLQLQRALEDSGDKCAFELLSHS